MNVRRADQPTLEYEIVGPEPDVHGVGVRGLDADAMLSIGQCVRRGGLLQSILRVRVAGSGGSTGGDLPDILGKYQVLENGLRFTPSFPFERGLFYSASFDPRAFGRPELAEVLSIVFSLPPEEDALPTEVQHIFPSSSCLPENLLRFYVCFSKPMQRGRARTEIAVLGHDGEPVADVLYHAPVELWDPSMRVLTVLLDPGRMKRGVGPNRELGPPLKTSEMYTLTVGKEMTDLRGGRLPATFHKQFRVTDAVREPVAIGLWETALPETDSRQPLVLAFPRSLDWALLSRSIAMISALGQPVDGLVSIGSCERRLSFTPSLPWAAGSYRIRIASDLEDICGNNVTAAFDRPLRAGRDLEFDDKDHSIYFDLA